MKQFQKRIISMLVCVGILLGLIAQSGGVSALATSLNIGTTKATDLKAKTDPSAEWGTDANPFTVLEIVPSHEEAQIGYFIPGCEPVNMEKAKYSMDMKGNFTSTLGTIYDVSDVTVYAFYDQIPSKEANEYLSVYVNDGNSVYHTREDVVYENTWLNYGQWRSTWNTEYSQKGDYIQVEAGQGNFNVNADSYKYVGESQGDYIWVPSDNGSTVRTQNNGDLFAYSYIKYKHKDEFIDIVFDGAKSSSFQTQVITMTPSELEGNLDIIDVADLITIHPGSGDYKGLAQIYYALNDNGDTATTIPDVGPTFWDKGKDLTYNEVMRITERMASDNPAALILDKGSMFAGSDAQKEYNCHKLLYMVLMYQPSVFWNTFKNYLTPYTGKDGSLKVKYTKGGTTGEYPTSEFWGIEETSEQWTYGGTTYGSVRNPFLFNPESGACMIDQVRYYNINGGGTDIFDKIFTYDSACQMLQNLLNGGDIKKTDMSSNGLWTNNITSDAFEDDDTSSLSYIRAVKYILQQPSYTPKLRILEIEPCDQYIYGSQGWKTYYQSLFPWYHPQSGEASWLDDENLIEVTTMPTWEFIGSTGQYDYDAKDANGNWKRLSTESSDDLIAKYDLIIIGSKQDASNGLNGYNKYKNGHSDSSVDLKNLIYVSVGGTLNNDNMTEWSQTKYSEYMDIRYSGNDITLKKLLELEDFLKAGKPIVVDSGLYKDGVVDTDKVDCDSKLYDLLTWKDTGKTSDGSDRNAQENIFVHGSIPTAKMKSLISKNTCRIEFYEAGYPVEYGYTTYEDLNNGERMSYNYAGKSDTAEGVIVNEIYQGKNSNGTATLTYHFYIAGNASDTYNAYLNIDLDGDGVYGGSLKEHSEVDNMNTSMGYAGTKEAYAYDTTEQALYLTIYDEKWNKLGTTNPNSHDFRPLEANTEYYATRNIPSSQQGIIPWKLEVQSRTNEYLRSSAIDYTAVYNKDNQEKIMVLQMSLRGSMDSDNFVKKDMWGHSSSFTAFTKDSIVVKSGESYQDFEARRISNGGIPETNSQLYNQMSNNQKQTVAKFETYLEPVQEFDVTIQFMFNKDWYQLFGVTKDSGPEYEQALANWKAFLSEYDMLVFGFVDQNCFTNDTVFAEGVKDFVAQGKSMMLSHDTISGTDLKTIGTTKNEYGKYNAWLRSIAGQRRAYFNKQANGTYEKSYTDVKVNGNTITNVSNTNLNDTNKRNYLGMWSAAIDGDFVDKDAYKEYNGNYYANEWPDNSTFMGLYAQKQHSSSIADRVSTNGASLSVGWANKDSWSTSFVKLTNNGQITSYPYKLDDVIEVLQTHTQYFQLDLEYQQDGDVNVWFNLSDRNDSEVQAFYDKDGKLSASDTPDTCSSKINMYSARDQDCRNSFYIYNKGNITYTGSGHGYTDYGSSKNALMTDDEVKLFVNTMISAYRQPESEPFVQIDNSDAAASDGTSILYLDYDGYQYATDAGPETGDVKTGIDNRVVTIDGKEMVAVELSVYDLSSANVNDKKNYLWINQDGKSVDPTHVILRKVTKDSSGVVTEEDVTYTKDENEVVRYNVSASVDGERYIMYIPYEDVTESGAVNYSFGTYATYIKSNRKITTSTSITKATVMLLPLFDLN